jgi:hypothetical protein
MVALPRPYINLSLLTPQRLHIYSSIQTEANSSPSIIHGVLQASLRRPPPRRRTPHGRGRTAGYR